MKRLLTITAFSFLAVTGVASAATLKPVVEGDSSWNSPPIFATGPEGDSRVFVVERGDEDTHQAAIRIVKNGVLQPQPFLTVSNVGLDSERGLLSMAFAPDYATSGLFYVFWIADGPDSLDPDGDAGDIRIVEFKRSADPDVADPASARLVLKTPHSAPNHNGGWMAFGPDDNLYFTIGDNATGGVASQVLTNLWGKVSRINPADPAGPGEFTIPADNPFPGATGQNRAIWTTGLRNPFRASFTPDGDLTIGDVGEVTTEEINVGNLKGKNMGWPTCEGFCDSPNALYTDPFFAYDHPPGPEETTGNAVIGGYVVRDPDLTGLTGRYLYGDGYRANLRTLNLAVTGGDPVDPDLSVSAGSLISFGEDSRGCSYVMADGTVYRLAANAAATADCPHEADVPDPPDPEVDTTRPDLTLGGNSQRLGKKLAFTATCSEKCSISTRGSLKAKRRGKKKAVGFRYTKASKDAAAGRTVRIVLRLKPRALKRARKILRSGRRLNATVIATAADPSGNERSRKLNLKVKRPIKRR